MAENCLLSLEPWSFGRPDSTLWNLTESFARDNDAFTRALQISLSDTGSPSGSTPETQSPSPQTLTRSFPKPDPATPTCSPSGRITKRKSRASKKSPTTYIAADPANFRQLVQQVTGVRFGSEPGGLCPVESLVRSESLRAGLGDFGGLVQGVSCLPTLDTSAVLLDRARIVGSDMGSVRPVAGQGLGSGFDFEGFSSFPTLESWGAM